MSVGPFFCVYLRPLWRMFAEPAGAEEQALGHPKFWRKLCKDVVAPHYGIRDAKTIRILSDLCYAMPRGRCSRPLTRRGQSTQGWVAYHGGDFPLAKDIKDGSDAIYSAFGLGPDQVRFVCDDHERMQFDDQWRIQELIGPVPYDGGPCEGNQA